MTRSCNSCRYGDNTPVPKGSSSKCSKLNLQVYDPLITHLPNPAHAFRVSKVTTITTLIHHNVNDENGER